MSRDPSPAEVIKDAIEARLLDLHTSMPGRVHVYNREKQTVDVEPVIKRAVPRDDGTYALEQLPIIHNVPIAYPRGGGYAIQFPLAKGDAVTLIFSEVATAIWRTTGQIAEPGDIARHDLSYACAYPGGASPANAALTPIVGNEMVISIDGLLRLGGPSADFVALASKVMERLSTIAEAFNSHNHPTAPLGPVSTPSATIPTLDDVGATKVKAE